MLSSHKNEIKSESVYNNTTVNKDTDLQITDPPAFLLHLHSKQKHMFS